MPTAQRRNTLQLGWPMCGRQWRISRLIWSLLQVVTIALTFSRRDWVRQRRNNTLLGCRQCGGIKVCHPHRKAGTIKWWATTPKVQVPARWHRTHNFWCRTLMYLFVRYNRQLLIPHNFCWLTGTCRGAIYIPDAEPLLPSIASVNT